MNDDDDSYEDIEAYRANLKPILDMIARKIEPDCVNWCPYKGDGYHVKCVICKSSLDDMSSKEVRAHGYQHLKERNLLPFV